MNLFFYIVEPLIYLAAGYFMIYKKDLAILYLPSLFFAEAVIDGMLPAIFRYGLFSFYIGFLIWHNRFFFRKNIFALLLFFLHLLLLPSSTDLVFIRPALFAVLWMFLLIPLTMAILEKYPRTVIFKELSNSVFIILTLFVANVLISTAFNYSPYDMYGMRSGILYGELVNTDFNILSVAIFVAFLFLSYKMDPWYLVLTLTSLTFIGLSMRRSVIGACILGFMFILLILFARGQTTQVFLILGIVFFTGIFVIFFTDFVSLFQERVEQRNLADRELAGEARFAEYAILYKDAFVHHDLNPWTGFELLNSGGNYGKRIYGDRTLHADIPQIIHSIGVIGLILYLLMIGKVFWEAIRNSRMITDRILVYFCCCIFIIFTLTGRYTQTEYILLLFLLLSLPLGKNREKSMKRKRFNSTKIENSTAY